MVKKIAGCGAFGGVCLPLLQKALALLHGQTLTEVLPGQEHAMGWFVGLLVVACISAGFAHIVDEHPAFRAFTTGLTLPAVLGALAGAGGIVAVGALGVIGTALAQDHAPKTHTIQISQLCDKTCVVFFRDDKNKVIDFQSWQFAKGALAVPPGAAQIDIVGTARMGIGKLPTALQTGELEEQGMRITTVQPTFFSGFMDALGLARPANVGTLAAARIGQ